MKFDKPIYCAALRMKPGELAGVAFLAPQIAHHFLPRFIVPPRKERDPRQPELIMIENAPDISSTLSRYWRDRDALIDLTYLIDECGRDSIEDWLPRLFGRARSAGGRPIPLAELKDLGLCEAAAFAAAIDRKAEMQFALSVPFDEIGTAECAAQIATALKRLGIEPRVCAVIADYSSADFSVPAVVAPIVIDCLERLQDIGRWRHVIFQGTHYPETNPAEPGGSLLVPRNELNAWMLGVGSDAELAQQMMFGDYAADCAKIDFGGSGGKAIPHYRYATSGAWLVERGFAIGTHKLNMRDVANRILKSGHFAGAGFSAADSFIQQTSLGSSPGGAKEWRQMNTTHHITQTVRDITALLRIGVIENGGSVEEPNEEQLSLLP